MPVGVLEVANAPTVAATNTYPQTVLGNSPDAYWRLGEGSGNLADSTTNSNTAVANGGVTYGAAGAINGDSNTAITLDGSSGYLEAPDSSSLDQPTAAITMESWVKPTSGGFGSQKPILVKGYTSHSNPYYQYALMMVDNSSDSDAVLMYLAIAGGLQSITVDNAGWLYGQWNHIVGTYDGSRMRLYVNGQQVGSQAQTGNISSYASTLDIGAYGNLSKSSSYLFEGGLDEIAVYPTALSALQVQTDYVYHYAAQGGASTTSSPYTKAVLGDSPQGYWRMDESSPGPYVRDRTAHGSDGTYTASGVSFAQAGAMLGDSDTAISFDGSSGYVGIPDSSYLNAPSSAVALEAWVRPTAGGFTSQKPILLKGYLSHSNPFYQYGLTMIDNSSYPTAATLYLSISGSLDSLQVVNTGWVYGAWNQIVGTYDGSQMRLYINGQLVGSQAQTGLLDSYATPLVIGAYANLPKTSNYLFSGGIDDVAVYSTALSAGKVLGHYMAAGNSRKPQTVPTGAELRGGGANACLPCVVHSGRGDPVDTANGSVSESTSDLSIPGRGLAIDVTRSYDSGTASSAGPLGNGWTFGYAMSLSPATAGSDQTITEENGSQVVFTYNASSGTYVPPGHDIATLVRNGDGTWSFQREARNTYTFDSSGRLSAEKDINGYTTTLSYTAGVLSGVSDPAGRSIAISWTGSHIAAISDGSVSGNVRTVSYQYNDGSGNLTDVIDVNGGHTVYAYDSSHRLTQVIDPQCYLTSGCPGVQNHYDSSGRVDWQKDQLGRETTFAYSGDPSSAAGSTTITTDPAGHAVLDAYQWNVKTLETKGYGTSATATTTYGYDPATLALTSVLDPRGNLTTYGVDSAGNVTSTTDPLGRTSTRTYNSFNEVLTGTDGNGVTTTRTYDAHGNLTATSTPLVGASPAVNQVTTYHHDDTTYPGDVTSAVDPDGKTTSYLYDSYGDLVEQKDPLGNVAGSVYNADGWLLASYTPKAGCTWGSAPPTGCSSTYVTTDSYTIAGSSAVDEFGDVQAVTDPLSHAVAYGYDADRRKTSVTDGNGHTTSYTFDVAGEQTKVTRPDASTLTTDYNSDGSVLDQKDGSNTAIITYTRDALGRDTATTDALGNTTSLTLDASGNVTSRQEPGGSCTGTSSKCTNYSYDGDNELTSISYSDNSAENVTAISYDSDGQRTGMTDGTGSSSWSYDSLHRLTSYTNGAGATVSYGYASDLKDQAATIAYPNSVGTVTQSWNDDGTLASVEDWNAKTIMFGYDANGNLHTITDPSSTAVVDTFGFNAADQMTNISDSNGSALFAATYTRDATGNVAADSSQPSAQSSFKYTSLDQLCYAGSSNSTACSSPPSGSDPYSYDGADNLINDQGTTQAFNAADELCWTVSGPSTNGCASAPTGATTYSYSSGGDRTAMVPGSGSSTCYSYDQAHRLIGVQTGTGSSCSGGPSLGGYTYDGTGTRETKTVSGTTTHFTWDQHGSLPMLLQEKAGTASPVSYIYGPGGVPVEQVSASTTTYLHHDQLGSTRLLTDGSGSSSTATSIGYASYGAVSGTSGSLSTPFLFAGQYRDAETGLDYLRARYYDPSSAQFLSRDPSVESTLSPYAYALDDPLNLSDPTGLDSCSWNPLSWGGCVQDVANAFVQSDFGKFANGWANGASFGLSSWAEGFTSNGAANLAIDQCSTAYAWGNGVGIATNVLATGAVGRLWAAGRELTIPFTNGVRLGLGVPGALTREGEAYWAARLPHYHRQITDALGNTVSGGALRWHRPWEGL